MPISTLQSTQNAPKKPGFFYAFIYISAVLTAVVVIFFGKNALEAIKKMGGKSALSVDVTSGRAEVYINDEMVGVTPFESGEIKPGDNRITLKSSNSRYETTIKFLSNNDEYIHRVTILRDLGVGDLFSSGQDLWFDEDSSGTVLRVISEPPGASIFIDNTEYGQTPFTSSKLSEGDYDIRVEHVGYEVQKSRVSIKKNYTSNVSFKLFPTPTPSSVALFEGSSNLYNVASDNGQIISDTDKWAKALVYWNQTRGINLEGVGLNKELVFDYFVDYQGNLFDKLGNIITGSQETEKFQDVARGAYLGRLSDGPVITEPAKEALNNLQNIQSPASEAKAKILITGTGWLRVRKEPNINSEEIGKVDVGKEYPILETLEEWVKIEVSETLRGWVSKTYIEIIEKVDQ